MDLKLSVSLDSLVVNKLKATISSPLYKPRLCLAIALSSSVLNSLK